MHFRKRIKRNTRWLFGGILLVGVGLFLALALPSIAGAWLDRESQPAFEFTVGAPVLAPRAQAEPPVYPPIDQACRVCHSSTESVIEFPSGESLPVMVDLAELAGSAHGDQAGTPLECTSCHVPADHQYPHQPVTAEDLRTYELTRAETCVRCHPQPHYTSHPGPDSENPVVCTDCHGSHNALTVAQWEDGEGSETCAACHATAGVPLTDPEILTGIIQGGMFSERIDKEYCLSCHSQEGLTLVFENGDELSLTVDPLELHDSVHGVDNSWQELDCTDCHGRKTFPHEPVTVGSAREYSLEKYPLCARCHEQHYERTQDSVHEIALESGNLEAAVCTDCHGTHDTPPPDEPRERISYTCRQCHSAIFDTYAESVHGEALLEDSNPDVATCIDCHGVHDINDPTTAQARNRSPELCAGCHADEELMAKYDISTDVFDTYVADFHGATVSLFENEDPNVETNKAVCYDCHGVHDIQAVDDPENGIKANLLETCRQCHPDANENFPDAWTSHYVPSMEHNPLIYLVETFYMIVIPVTVVMLVLLVGTDIFRIIRMRLKRQSGDK